MIKKSPMSSFMACTSPIVAPDPFGQVSPSCWKNPLLSAIKRPAIQQAKWPSAQP